MTEPRTDRVVLANEAYASGQYLSARQSFYNYQEPSYDLPAMVLEHLPAEPGLVVDVGCGNGRYASRLRSERPDLFAVGLDVAPGIMRDVPPPVVVGDAAALPFPDRAATAVLAMHMLYHVADLKAGLTELARVVRGDGVVIASTNAADDKRELDELWSAAAADVLGVSSGPQRVSLSSRFSLDQALEHLGHHFTNIHLIALPGTIIVTEPEPVLAHLASYRAWAARASVPFDATIDRVRERLTEMIEREGKFVVSCHGGLVVCRDPR